MVDAITRYSEIRIAQLGKATDKELQAEIDRPARGSVNPNFDFDKWNAMIIKEKRRIKREEIKNGKR